MKKLTLKPNDWVVYRKQKTSTSPGPRASHVHPSPKGDHYSYQVDKYWVVEEVISPEQIKVCTRRGKRNIVSLDDPSLRLPSWWERLVFRSRFAAVDFSIPASESDEV